MGFLKYLVVPGAMTGAYFVVRKNKKLNTGQKAAIVAGTGLLTFLVQRTAASFAGNVQKAPVDYGQIPYIYDSAGRPVKWDPDPLAKDMVEYFHGDNLFVYPEIANKIVALNPDQVKLLYNHYNEYYAEPSYPTLTKMLEAEWGSGTYYSRAINKLKSLGLN